MTMGLERVDVFMYQTIYRKEHGWVPLIRDGHAVFGRRNEIGDQLKERARIEGRPIRIVRLEGVVIDEFDPSKEDDNEGV